MVRILVAADGEHQTSPFSQWVIYVQISISTFVCLSL